MVKDVEEIRNSIYNLSDSKMNYKEFYNKIKDMAYPTLDSVDNVPKAPMHMS